MANQEIIQSQITQLEDTIKQMEVNELFFSLYPCTFVSLYGHISFQTATFPMLLTSKIC